MLISIINNTDLHHQEVQDVLRAVNRQLQEDFKKYWHKNVELRLEGWLGEDPDPDKPLDMRGDAVIYLWDEEDIEDALGYHHLNNQGVPYGFVFRRLSEEFGEPWSVTLSHEALELAADPEINLLAQGPHPDKSQGGRTVYHWYELCDAVQGDTYEIDGIKVSNFVLPLYFTQSEEHKSHNDFLGLDLESFGAREGGYLGFFDPETGDHETWHAPQDFKAIKRLAQKARYGKTKRTPRRRSHSDDEPLNDASLVSCDVITFEVTPKNGIKPKDLARRLIRDHLGDGWILRLCPADPSEFDARYKGPRLIGFGEAWELCQALQDSESVVFAEPSFPVPVPGASDLPSDDKRLRRSSLSGGKEHLPETETKFLWAIEQCKVPAAWDLIRAAGKLPGEGVRIGHPDSGFQKHSEMDISRVLLGLDRDFLDDDDDAQTETQTNGKFNGSHGLATASVIMSGESGIITGPALHSEIVPLRVTKPGLVRPTPVLTLFGMWRLRDAVDYAASIGCQVISMSLGGIPSYSLKKAIRRATDKGIIVLVAAGNEVRFVTPPASYDETIAVAGCNYDRKPWKGSCRGKKVDITAPAESVWVARIEKDGSESKERGFGTSFAVALVAGIAALWRAYHADALDKRKPQEINDLFRQILSETRQKEASLPLKKFGGGIVDAEAILKKPIPRNLRRRTRRSLSTINRAQLKELIDGSLPQLDEIEERELLTAEIMRKYLSATGSGPDVNVGNQPDEIPRTQRAATFSEKSRKIRALSPRLQKRLNEAN